jgi:hypothetical protein
VYFLDRKSLLLERAFRIGNFGSFAIIAIRGWIVFWMSWLILRLGSANDRARSLFRAFGQRAPNPANFPSSVPASRAAFSREREKASARRFG